MTTYWTREKRRFSITSNAIKLSLSPKPLQTHDYNHSNRRSLDRALRGDAMNFNFWIVTLLAPLPTLRWLPRQPAKQPRKNVGRIPDPKLLRVHTRSCCIGLNHILAQWAKQTLVNILLWNQGGPGSTLQLHGHVLLPQQRDKQLLSSVRMAPAAGYLKMYLRVKPSQSQIKRSAYSLDRTFLSNGGHTSKRAEPNRCSSQIL